MSDDPSSYPDSAPSSSSAASESSASGGSGTSDDELEASGSGISTARIVGIVAVIAILGILIVPRVFFSEVEAETGEQEVDETPRVSGYIVEPHAISDRLFTTGALRAYEEVELVSETSGRITQILFSEGSRVAEGQLLLTTNDAELQAELERLQHELELAEQREARQRQLLERGGISQEEYDDVQNRVSVLRAEERLIQARIDKAQVRAPFSGTIGLRHVSPGSYLSQQDRIATLRSINPIKIDFTVPERYASRVSTGDQITFNVEGVDEVFQGRIYAAETGISPASRSLQLRAEASNPDARLLPGLFANIQLEFEQIEDAIVVPAIAVLAEEAGAQVFVKENGEVARRSVQTGIRTDSTVQIVEGLSVQDTVLTSGLQLLQPGERVEVEGVDDLPEEEQLEDLREPEPDQMDTPGAPEVGGNQ